MCAFPRFRFPWRDGNAFALLVDGARFYPAMLAEIERAERHVWIEMYLVQSGELMTRFVDALVAAAGRGVQVRLLFDAFGSLGLQTADRARLKDAGIGLAFYNPIELTKRLHNLARDHRKLLVVDGRVAYTGGGGLTDEFAPKPPPARPWRETMLEIRGPLVADWQVLFADIWLRATGERLFVAPTAPASVDDGMRGRVEVSQANARREIARSLLKAVRTAERRVWVSTAYFIPAWRLRRALRRSARSGVDVRVLLPGPETDHPAVRHAGRRFYGRLLLAGVRIHEYQPRFIHSKVALCDDWASIGSSNFDRWNLHWNLEANQVVTDRRFAQAVARMLEDDLAQSHEYRLSDWIARPWAERAREYLWGKVDLWLDALGHGRPPRHEREPVGPGSAVDEGRERLPRR